MLSAAMRSSSARCLSSASAAASTSSSFAAVACPSSFRRGMAGMAGRDVRMRVILKEDCKLGLKHDIVDVKRGYGRNVLVRQGKADYATEENKYLSSMAQLRERAAKAAAAPVDTSSEDGTDAEQSAAAASAAPVVVQLPEETLRYYMDVSHRLSSQRSLAFFRAADGRDLQPVTLRDIYVKLTRQFPSVALSQLAFANGAEAITKAGDFLVEVSLPGLLKPASVRASLKKIA